MGFPAGGVPTRDADIDLTNIALKGSSGRLMSLHVASADAATTYIQFYNTTDGSGTPAVTIPIPAGGVVNINWNEGVAFDTAISMQGSTAFDGTGAPDAGDLIGTATVL